MSNAEVEEWRDCEWEEQVRLWGKIAEMREDAVKSMRFMLRYAVLS